MIIEAGEVAPFKLHLGISEREADCDKEIDKNKPKQTQDQVGRIPAIPYSFWQRLEDADNSR